MSIELSTWESLARAIIGSGSYAVRGETEEQIDVLVGWLRTGRDQGFDWQSTYASLYRTWCIRNPHLPAPEEMRSRVEFGRDPDYQ